MKRVVIFQYRLLHYRLELFNRLRDACAKNNIELILVCGQASRRESVKKDEGILPWAQKVKNRFWEIGARDLVWQPFPRKLRDADLVIVMQENRILSNYLLLLSRLWSSRRVAYWGHGANFQTDSPNGLREKWKRVMLTKVDWWFSYTQMSAEIVRRSGFPERRITCIDNAIDNDGFARDLASVSDEDLGRLRQQLDIDVGAPVGLFCGSLYPDKKLDLLVDAGDRIHGAIPAFRMVVVGAGPSSENIQLAAATRPWLKWVGAQKGVAKATYFRLADVVLNPGLVGLHVLDSFCAGVPLITTAEARHSPEIAYLKSGENGLVVEGGVVPYADAVIGLLNSPSALAMLSNAAMKAADRYSLDNMVSRFVDGIVKNISGAVT